MPLNKLFEGSSIRGTAGVYPLTAENLLRVGLALCILMVIEEREPLMCVNELNFCTMSLAVGFMNGGGDVIVGTQDCSLNVIYKQEENFQELVFIGLSEEDKLKLESILYSRYNMPKKEGNQVGRLWIQESRP
ncbi:hypothetical protein [Thermocrinis minervae]|uniref:Uncharacterized protein n=1 Tax=Thermocrinis minervae TaxID=381751 RepID=A0A1M6RY92_9AQUI|nr:hypothetical protein [Thermocrinis minervae]SHK37502.1 hypothetical protein SAMN05444391_0813 [Thermocrinis minervae]